MPTTDEYAVVIHGIHELEGLLAGEAVHRRFASAHGIERDEWPILVYCPMRVVSSRGQISYRAYQANQNYGLRLCTTYIKGADGVDYWVVREEFPAVEAAG